MIHNEDWVLETYKCPNTGLKRRKWTYASASPLFDWVIDEPNTNMFMLFMECRYAQQVRRISVISPLDGTPIPGLVEMAMLMETTFRGYDLNGEGVK